MTLVPRSLLPHSGSIVVLNGTSSSGKTSLAKALQAVAPEQYLHVQLNAYRDMEPVGYFSRERSEAWPMRVAALCRAMHSTVIEFSGHGQNVIFDHVMSPDAWHYLLEDFQDQRLFLIRVHCDVEELLRREQARGDREHGLAQSQAERIHENREYDFSIDTSHSSPSECAAALLQWLQQNPQPAAFAKMRSRHAAV